MSNTEAPISITVKTPNNSLVTVRANSGEELDQLMATSFSSIVSAFTELESATRTGGSAPALPPNPVTAYVAQAFNATPVQDVPPFSPAPIGGGRNCKHGKMTAIQGPSKTGGVYKGYFCPTPQGATDKCKTEYLNPKSGDWNTFVADRING